MSDEAQTRYARAGDVYIAYQVVGDRPLDLLLVDVWSSPLEARWDEPLLSAPLNRLASFSRLISFDRRGLGLSDPVPINEISTLEEWMNDAITVMDKVGVESAAVVATSDSGPVGMLLAATFPHRVSALVLCNTCARFTPADGYPWGTASIRTGTRDAFELVHPSIQDAAFRRRFNRYWRYQASPAVIRALLRMMGSVDLRSVLPSISAPTLVLHRLEDGQMPVEHARYLAEHIPNAKLVELPGADNVWWSGDAGALVDEIEEFLTGVRPALQTDRLLATVLFTDIVDSTRKQAELGDTGWKELMNRHDDVIRRELGRHRGNQVNTTGDGVLVTFDGPARAVRCAIALHEAMSSSLGIDVRVGLHTGEVELRGDDLTGMAVNIAARVMQLAKGGETLVSRTVTDLVAGSGLQFEERGEHELKGVPGKWAIYAVKP